MTGSRDFRVLELEDPPIHRDDNVQINISLNSNRVNTVEG